MKVVISRVLPSESIQHSEIQTCVFQSVFIQFQSNEVLLKEETLNVISKIIFKW